MGDPTLPQRTKNEVGKKATPRPRLYRLSPLPRGSIAVTFSKCIGCGEEVMGSVDDHSPCICQSCAAKGVTPPPRPDLSHATKHGDLDEPTQRAVEEFLGKIGEALEEVDDDTLLAARVSVGGSDPPQPHLLGLIEEEISERSDALSEDDHEPPDEDEDADGDEGRMPEAEREEDPGDSTFDEGDEG